MIYLPLLKNDREEDIPKIPPALNNLEADSGDKPVNLPVKKVISKKSKE